MHLFAGVAFSPDGTRLASASYDETVKVWDVASGQELRTLRGHTGSVRSVAFSPDGARLASASSDNTVKVWDAGCGQEVGRGRDTVFGSDDLRTLGFIFNAPSDSSDRTVKGRDGWDDASGQAVRTFYGANSRGLAFSPDGRRLATASWDATVKVWDAATGQDLCTLRGHTAGLNGVAFSPDGARLASASVDKTAKVWDVANGKELRTLKGHTGRVSCVVFSPDGTRLASASDDRTVKVWDAADGKELCTLKGHTGRVSCVVFSPDGARLASASLDMTVKLWDTASGQELRTFQGYVRVSDGRAFRLIGPQGRIISHRSQVQCVAFSPVGCRLASSGGGQLKVWDAASGQELRTINGHAAWSVAFSPDGARLASAGADHRVKVWEVASGQELCTLKAHADMVTSVAFSPDGMRLASASFDKTVKVWDARPLTTEIRAEREAVDLVEFLFSKGLVKAQAIEKLRNNKTINEPTRQKLAWIPVRPGVCK
jgi:WD40 repeat protein